MGESQQWILSRTGEPTKLSIFLHETARMMLESPSSHYFTAWFHSVLAAVGVPKPYPTADQIALCTLAAMTGLVLYFLAFGWRHRNQRSSMEGRIERLRNELAQAEGKLKDMDSGTVKRKADGKPIRIWMDGAFDMMHYGHMNAFRQGRALGTQLVVGINSVPISVPRLCILSPHHVSLPVSLCVSASVSVSVPTPSRYPSPH